MKPTPLTQSARPVWRAPGRPPGRVARAFTLIEMLVVMGIIALLLGIVLPNLHGFRSGHEMDAAARQLTADLNLARAKAIGGRSTVAVVFIPPGLDLSAFVAPSEKSQVSQLQGGMYSQYALYSFRDAGDQPGRNTARYLTRWQKLPERTFLATNKFGTTYGALVDRINGGVPVKAPIVVSNFLSAKFLFPFDTNLTMYPLPYVAFDYEGRLIDLDPNGSGNSLFHSEPLNFDNSIRIPLTRGAVFPTLDGGGNLTGYAMTETPPGNFTNIYAHVVINCLTGRAKIERQEAVLP